MLQIETTRIKDHGIFVTVNHIITITIRDPLITLGAKQKHLSRQKKHLLHNKNKTTYSNSQSQNYRNNIPLLKKALPDPPRIDKTKNLGIKLAHIYCETTDDESDTENTLLRYMLHIENE